MFLKTFFVCFRNLVTAYRATLKKNSLFPVQRMAEIVASFFVCVVLFFFWGGGGGV